MTARCHIDSCTVLWSEVNNASGPAFQADVRLDPNSLVCGPEGIDLMISPSGGNIISNPGNGIYASLPTAIVTTLSGNPENKGVAPSADIASPQSSDTYTWANASGRDALVLVTGELNFKYGILGPSHAYSYAAGNGQKAGRLANTAYDATGVGAPTNKLSPFNAQIGMRLLADVNAAPVTSVKATRVPASGMIVVSNIEGADLQTVRVPFFHMMRVPAGATLNMKSQAFFEGPSQTVNVVATPSAGTGLGGTGHELWNLQVSAVPV